MRKSPAIPPAEGEIPKSAPSAPESTEVERLFREHNASLLRFIAAKIGSEQEAKEIAQEAYVHLLQLDHPEAISYLRAFLFKTASNLAVDRLRQRGRRAHVMNAGNEDFSVFELSPERHTAGEQTLDLFRTAVQELPARCRQAFLLHRIHDMHVEDIATQMNLQPRMVRRYISRALDYIQARLDRSSRFAAEDRP
jgi:RNA polymerase sigma factor (sigma-70 family)